MEQAAQRGLHPPANAELGPPQRLPVCAAPLTYYRCRKARVREPQAAKEPERARAWARRMKAQSYRVLASHPDVPCGSMHVRYWIQINK